MAKTNDSNKDVVQNTGNFKVLEPPHNLHLARKIGVVKCRVDLYKIPPQYINFEPTKTHLYLDTFKYSKKFKLEVPYPEGVQVDTSVEATFDSGVLKCDFPILNDPNKPAGLDKIVEAREIVKELRKKGIPVPIDLMKSAQMAKVKERADEAAEEDSKKKPAPAKKGKVPLSNKDKRQKEKAKRALTEDPEDPLPRKKKTKTEQPDQPKKNFVENASDALNMVDEVNDQQEKAIQEKMDREYNKLSVDTRKKIERQEKKLQLRALRKQEAEDADTTKPKKVKSNKKKTTKVSFAE